MPPTILSLVRSRVLRCALAFVALAQLGTTVLIAADSARETRSAAAHVETPGGRKHYVHDESRCIACIAHHLVGDAPRPVTVIVTPIAHPQSPVEARIHIALPARRTAAAPRAPPVVPSV